MLVASFSLVQAQIDVPAPSPLGSINQKVGLSDLSVTYSRPSVKGRTIFGDLVPYGSMWRLGANASTKFKTSSDITIEGKDVPAGEYALYAIPNKDSWTMILHKNTSYWGTGGDKYSVEEDLARFEVKPNNAYPLMVETMTFQFTDITSEDCYLELTWANTQVRIKIHTDVDKKVMASIDEKMKGISSATYYQAARYYLENDKDLNKALEWINLSLVDNEKFWMVRQKALILAKMERYDDAIKTAELSKSLAETAQNNDYVRLNEKSIEEWKKMKKKK
jgi:tetratricopeptide (TPR) repeat protein